MAGDTRRDDLKSGDAGFGTGGRRGSAPGEALGTGYGREETGRIADQGEGPSGGFGGGYPGGGYGADRTHEPRGGDPADPVLDEAATEWIEEHDPEAGEPREPRMIEAVRQRLHEDFFVDASAIQVSA
ncbi:MAG TPA: hypothetical protein VEA41_17530, partial [Salinarimonas sp.]|nr:hypothetical protein [Salinarimonas sp.]